MFKICKPALDLSVFHSSLAIDRSNDVHSTPFWNILAFKCVFNSIPRQHRLRMGCVAVKRPQSFGGLIDNVCGHLPQTQVINLVHPIGFEWTGRTGPFPNN